MKVEHINEIPAPFLESSPAVDSGLLAEWRGLAADLPLCDSDWLLSWWLHFGPAGEQRRPHRELCLLAVRDDDGTLAGLAPWYIERSLQGGRIIRFLGSGIACTDYLTLLSQPGRTEEVVAAVADWLTGEGRDYWERIELVGVDDEDQAIPLLMEQLAERGNRLHRRPGDNTWRMQLAPSWEEFLGTLSASRRTKVRSWIRREFDAGASVMDDTADVVHFDENWQIFEELHQARRTAVGDPGVFSDPDFAAFLRDAGRRLWGRDALDLLVLRRDGEPICVEFNLVSKDVVFGYQGGMDPAALKHRPGNLMMVARFRRAIERGRNALDLMRGDEPYKAEWGADCRTSTQYRVVQRRSLAQARHQLWLAGSQARQIAKKAVNASKQVVAGKRK